MKTIKTLIKFHKKQLDNLLNSINALESQKNQLNLFLEDLNNQAKKESENYIGTEYAFMLDKYLANLQVSRKQLTTQITQLTCQIKLLRDQLHDKFAELKKFEIALQNRLIKEQMEVKKAETKFLDELNNKKYAHVKKNGT